MTDTGTTTISATEENRILVVAPAWIGDMIMAQTLLSYLRRKSPEVELEVLAPAATLPLVSRMPEVDLGIAFKLGHGEFNLGYRRGLGEKLKERRYRCAYVLPNSFKSAFVPFFADIPVRTGFRGEYRYVLINDMRMLNKERLPRMVDRFLTLAVPVGAPLPEVENPELMVDQENREECLGRLGLDTTRPVLGLCPGAEFGDSKQWPTAHFANLAARAVSKGRQVWILGGPNDIDTGREIVDQLGAEAQTHVRDLTGKTSLHDVIDLLSLCASVVSNDSGLMHIAAAVKRPVVALYGSTSPDFTPPLSENAAIVSENLSCSPCFKRTCPLGHKNCLVGMLPEKVDSIVESQFIGTSQ